MADLTDCEVGEYAMVPHVRLTVVCWRSSVPSLGKGSLVPIIGPMHEDKEIIGFPHEHWHIDWRFVAPKVWKEFTSSHSREGFVHEEVVARMYVTGEVCHRRRKMRRVMPRHPNVIKDWGLNLDSQEWLGKLEEKYAGAKACGRVCPHRGLPLVRSNQGLLVCSGHGLCWSEKTGELVRQRGQTKVKDGGLKNG